jgi:hypothetical protein
MPPRARLDLFEHPSAFDLDQQVSVKLQLLQQPGEYEYEEVARLDSSHDGRPMLTLVYRRVEDRSGSGSPSTGVTKLKANEL